jgi:hypothetical protein
MKGMKRGLSPWSLLAFALVGAVAGCSNAESTSTPDASANDCDGASADCPDGAPDARPAGTDATQVVEAAGETGGAADDATASPDVDRDAPAAGDGPESDAASGEAGPGIDSATEAGGPGASCVTNSECSPGLLCGYRIALGCSATGACAQPSNTSCVAPVVGCACDGTMVYVECDPQWLPAGLATKPVAHYGACSDAAVCTPGATQCAGGGAMICDAYGTWHIAPTCDGGGCDGGAVVCGADGG